MSFLPSEELRALLRDLGAGLVGFADMTGLSHDGLNQAVALAVPLPSATVTGIEDGPTREYFQQYHAVNEKLNQLAEAAAEYIQSKGFHAVAQTTTTVVEQAGYRTAVPHKTCATRAGLGWIGKSALLVTPEYGSAVRLSSVLTDGVFDKVGQPMDVSRCGGCQNCAKHCPGHAITGTLWSPSVPREELVDVEACRTAARKLAAERVGETITLCGKCIQVCPYTQAYLQREGRNA